MVHARTKVLEGIARRIFWKPWIIAGIVLLAAGCGRGPMGPEGPSGPAGVSLIQVYSGTAAYGDFSVAVPEITGRSNSTFVSVYYALPSAPDIYTPMTDGWKDDTAASRTSGVSWAFGKVYFFGMTPGDLYLIKVYQND